MNEIGGVLVLQLIIICDVLGLGLGQVNPTTMPSIGNPRPVGLTGNRAKMSLSMGRCSENITPSHYTIVNKYDLKV